MAPDNINQFILNKYFPIKNPINIAIIPIRIEVSTRYIPFQRGDKLFDTASKFIASRIVDNDYFNLFLILFIATVGLLAAKDISLIIRKYGGKFIILAFIITLTGAISTYSLALLATNTSSGEIIGVYTGALTSSPGFAAALETSSEQTLEQIDKYETLSKREKEILLNLIDTNKKLNPENTPTLNKEQKIQILKNQESAVSIGHSISYPFGVLIVILAINFLPFLPVKYYLYPLYLE
ncbi:unnamed protein product [marine sediment metagenome]|uniref:YidE/YbjL duplication domain-containing protein n=1 Tax=marine sediment metagenome TaxID=412755 RepID=X1T8U0_9ZZZZ